MKLFGIFVGFLASLVVMPVQAQEQPDATNIIQQLAGLAVQTSQSPIPEPPGYTLNIGVQSIDARMFRIVHELTKNESARTTSIGVQDKGRMDQYYSELLTAIQTVGIVGTDTCKTDFHYLFPIDLTEITDPITPVENESINSAVMYLYGANIGLRISQSTRRNDCLEATDAEDLVEAVNKSKIWLDTFYTTHSPLDMPQSHPQRDVVEPSAAM